MTAKTTTKKPASRAAVRLDPLVSVTVEIPESVLKQCLQEMSIRVQVVECGMDVATPIDKIAFAVLKAHHASHANVCMSHGGPP